MSTAWWRTQIICFLLCLSAIPWLEGEYVAVLISAFAFGAFLTGVWDIWWPPTEEDDKKEEDDK